ncbi:MAG: hypothetical protein Q9185_003183 [Variospora sp. 1 TL-2023]
MPSNISPTPALRPPAGVTPNFVNPASRAPGVIAATAVISAVMLLFVVARVYAKVAYARSQLGWEDTFCVIGTMLSMTIAGVIFRLFRSGVGKHTWDIRDDVFRSQADLLATSVRTISTVYNFAMIFTKLSILLLLHRLFGVARRARIWINIGIAMTLIIHIIGAILFLTVGAPLDAREPASYGTRTNILGIVMTTINIFGDIYILILPLTEVVRLQVCYSQRLRILASRACIAGIVGVVMRFTSWPYPDVSWNAGHLMVTPLYEICMGLIVSCMPILPLFTKHNQGSVRFLPNLQSLPSRGLTRCGPYFRRAKNDTVAKDTHPGHLPRAADFPAVPRQNVRLRDYDKLRWEPPLADEVSQHSNDAPRE